MPVLRAFRALRYAHAPGADVSALVCPPYDIIGANQHEALLARDPHNAVRLESPLALPGADPTTRYREAARAVALWRSEKVLVKDREPTITLHEMTFAAPDGGERRALGVVARVRLEPFSDGPHGIRRHERTMTGPKEDRYQLLRATGINLSPVVLLHEADAAGSRLLLERLTQGAPVAVATTDDGVRHRVWVRPASSGRDAEDGTGPAVTPGAADADALLALIGGSPLTIADGHHRYETALRYQAERGQNRACESDPAWDTVMALLYHVADAPPVLPTHRVLLDGPTGDALLERIADLVDVEPVDGPDALLARMSRPAVTSDGATGTGRIGLVSGEVAAILTVRAASMAALMDPTVSDAARGLDVNRVAGLLERAGVDAAALAAGDRVRYAKVAAEAVALVAHGAAAAFLLDGPPVAAVTRVAAAGEVMPQKSTYFDPKAPTGLVFGPLEW